MPTPAHALTSMSSPDEAKTAISGCISQMTQEHPDWTPDRVQAACFSMAKEAMGGASVVSKTK